MIVVSDTSSISALLKVGQCELLRQLYGEVMIPEAVRSELARAFSTLPQYVRCAHVENQAEVHRLLQELDLGEAEAIVPARQIHADALLMDETKGRRIALREGLPLIGLVGVILFAKREGLVPSVRKLIERLESEASFRLAAELKQSAFQTAGEL